MHYPKSEEVKLSIGLLSKLEKNYIFHLCNTDKGSSGAPIVSLQTQRVIGLHFGGDKINNLFNLGTFIKNPIIKFYEKLNNDNNHKINEEYLKKIRYKFIKEPQNLKYKYNIIRTNDIWGANDLFEIFISYKDNKEYIVSPNFFNFNLDILTLLDNHLIKSLKGHLSHITTIRYFINNKNFNEYLISGDQKNIVIIWDITDNYSIKYKINTNYKNKGDIYSCLLIFPHNINYNFIITSTQSVSDDNDNATKIYSFNNCEFIRYINNTSINPINYLLSWNNKNNDKYYIIQLSKDKILINNLIENELYSELKKDSQGNLFGALITYQNNKEYLFTTSQKLNIIIWDLYKKDIFKIIYINSFLVYITEWNNKYIIVGDYTNKSFRIIDIENDLIIANIGGHDNRPLTCVKKINHPIYGESLLTASWDKTINLWSI